MNPIRTLTAREIECRVAQISRKGDAVSLLLYKDARCDMAILDETFGPMNWQRRHTRDNANCIVSIWDESKHQWIEKEDTGTESNTEAQKGLASDSFKRACFNVGIGRELYTAPQIWIKKPNCTIEGENGRYKCYDRFDVAEIGYDENREINRLVITNAKTGAVVYTFGNTLSEGLQGPKNSPKRTVDKEPAQPTKTAERGHAAPQRAPSARQMATEEQKQYIRDHASDEYYLKIMEQFGAELEDLTANDAGTAIREIDKTSMAVTCERCGKPITGLALPDGTTMTSSEVIARSKMKFNAVYCVECAKVLDKKRKAG